MMKPNLKRVNKTLYWILGTIQDPMLFTILAAFTCTSLLPLAYRCAKKLKIEIVQEIESSKN